MPTLKRSPFPSRRKLMPLVSFDVSLVQKRLDGLLINVDRDLHRKIRAAGTARNGDLVRQLTLMVTMVRIASNAYAGLCYLIVDQGAPHWRKNFALLLAPVNRQLMDILFSIVYMRDDFAPRTLMYERAAFRAFKEEYQLYQSAFRGHPEWRPFFVDQKMLLRLMAKSLRITLAEKRKLELIPRWKQPFKLSRQNTKSQPFLKWMVKWLYNDTSAEAHISGAGLFFISPFLLADLAEDQIRHAIESRALLQYHARHLSRTFMTVLAIATEIDAQFKLNNHTDAAYIWRVLIDNSPEAKEMYQERYKAMLAPTSS
jgi:hypothetical protein